jgi:integrase
MSALPVSVEFDPLRDKTYRRAALGPDVVAFLAWLELGGASPTTVDDYERALAVACRMYPQTPIDKLTDVQLGQVFRRFPIASRRVRVAPYSTFFKWARQTRRIEQNPMELMPAIKRTPRREFDIFSEAEIDLLTGLLIIDAAPMALLFDAGLRRREACEMTDRRWNPDWVQVLNGKGSKDRRVPTSSRLCSVLAEWEIVEGINPDDHILYGVKANGQGARRVLRKTPIGEGTFARWWRRCLDEAGVRYRNPHMARHTCATRWRRQGHAIDDISDWLGHADLDTTKSLYVHSTFEESLERFRLKETELA